MPSAAPPLVGRTQEIAALTAALGHAARGRGALHLIVGEGGIGKTRLALLAGELAAAQGFTCLVGSAYALESGIPYALFADAFVPVLRAMPSETLQVLARGAAGELAMLFPSLRTEAAPPARAEGDDLKPRLLDAFARLLHRLAERTPLLIVLENLHWADPSSLELLHFVARGVAERPILLLGTYNETQREGNRALRMAEQSLASLGLISTHQLPALTRQEASDLVTHQFGVSREMVAEFVAVLHDRTRGNPFFIEETLKSLLASGRLRRDSSGWTGWGSDPLELPRTIRDALDARLERLSPGARRVATVAAVVGTGVPHALLESIAGLDGSALLEAVDELRRERVLQETPMTRDPAYEFTHPLLAETLYTALSRARARAMHGEIAEALERLMGDRAPEHAGALAVHFLRSEAPEHAPRACQYLEAAGRSALDRGADREAVEVLESALALAGHRADLGLRATLLDLAARARQRLGDYARAAELWQEAITIAHANGDLRLVSSFERHLGLGAFWSGRHDDALTHYDQGLAAANAVTDAPAVASLLLARGAVHLELGRAAEAEADARSALAIAERLATPGLLSRVHLALQSLGIWQGPSQAAREHGSRALAFATEAHDRRAAWQAHWGMAMHAGLTGDGPGTARHVAAASALAEELRSPLLRLSTAEIDIQYRSGIGEWDEAIAIAGRTISDARAFGQRTLLPRVLVWTSLLHLGRGDFDVARAQIDEAWTLSGADDSDRGGPIKVHAVVPAHVGRAAWFLARRRYRKAIEIGEAGLAISDATGYGAWSMHRLLPIIAEASLWLQDLPRAEHY
ncbi:MAG TPA: AAA family ATPase, partial [Gemmatimonadaceae bacterium]|nr:AAA family ATPase [Gemmatimonadaceae bacterium]